MIRTHVILDGLQDPLVGRALSARWASAAFHNAVDVAGQCAWLAPKSDSDALNETDMDRAAGIARAFGLELRDRVGNTFVADNDLATLRDKLVHEYKSRFATALVFGLPALALHYLGPLLAGHPTEPRGMFYPWLFELLLVGWACIAAGWPILWQGGLALVRLRVTGDLLTSVIVIAAFVPSAVGVVSMLGAAEPWMSADGPACHAAILAIIIAVLQRWMVHRAADRLSGRAMLMLRRFGRLVRGWILASVIVGLLAGWHWGLAVALLLPPMMSLGAINALTPGWSAVLPVMAFAGLFLLAPGALHILIDGVQIETAAVFALMMTLVFAWCWRRFEPMREVTPKCS
ncbi:MAG: hypothetical protein V3U29_08610 [Phycisphaeraceae bacterium]